MSLFTSNSSNYPVTLRCCMHNAFPQVTSLKTIFGLLSVIAVKNNEFVFFLSTIRISRKNVSSFPVKNMGTAKAYLFRVYSHSLTSYSVSKNLKYDVPDNVKRRAVTAGLIGGILFFIVAIVLSVCTVKICNKRRRRKQERGKDIVRGMRPPIAVKGGDLS